MNCYFHISCGVFFNLSFLKGDLDCVQALLEGSVSVNQFGNSGLSALHIAAMCGHSEVIFLVLLFPFIVIRNLPLLSFLYIF